MFDVNQIPPVLEHLKQISPNMFRVIPQGEIIIHCPFCDDALRKKALNHGHLYISTTMPVFSCFRCNSSGTLLSLLLQTGFDDQDVLKYISSFIKINFTKDYFRLRNQTNLAPRFSHLKKELLKYTLNFKKNYYNHYINYRNYINKRLGPDVDPSTFLLSPSLYKNSILMCRFTNHIGENVLLRHTDNNVSYNQRYIVNTNTSNLYYFQNIHNNINKITICEGPFDVISLYLYNDLFKDNIFISINGKNYVNNLERLIIMYYLIDDLEINIIFDSDHYNKSRKILLMLKKIIQIYNGKIWINAFKPLIGNDVADFPAVVKIDWETKYESKEHHTRE